MSEHKYQLKVEWTGNTGVGTKDARSFERSLSVQGDGKETILGSSDPAFKGDATKWNPEEMLVASLSSCHMLWYLHLLAMRKIVAVSYVDHASATLHVEANGEGHIKEAILAPVIIITDVTKVEEAMNLHEEAHKRCYIARSINFPTKINPTILVKES